MAFEPRYYDIILMDMIAHMQANTTITDYSVGSVIRTLLEAAALEDDEQYYQMVRLLDAFRTATAAGVDLDERSADFNVSRLSAKQASTRVKFRNDSLTKSTLTYNTVLGATTFQLDDSSEFPVSGYPYTVRLGEGTATVEDVAVTNNNTTSNIITAGAAASNHSAGDRVAEVTGSDQTLAIDISVQVKAKADAGPIPFSTVEQAVLLAGNYESTTVLAKATSPGTTGNVGVGEINQFTGSPPFTGAAVTNVTASAGGTDRETDSELKIRLKERLSALGKGTIRAIEAEVKGVSDDDTGQQVVSANLLENFTTEEHILYVDDGTGFVPTTVYAARTNVNNGGVLTVGSATIPVDSSEDFPSSGFVLVSPTDSTQAELLEYVSKSTGVLTLNGTTIIQHDDNDLVVYVAVLELAEEGQNFFQIPNYPSQRNSYTIYDNSSGEYKAKVEGTDYFYNRTNGQIQYYGAGLPVNTQILVSHNYYTGLFAKVQKVVSGSPLEPTLYPGVAAAGVIVYVATPTIVETPITISIAVENGFDEEEKRIEAQSTVESYVSGLFIGQNIILAEIVERVMGLQGMYNVKVLYPDFDIVILENELPRPYDTLGSSLVTVL